jgi:hypothetical protein
MTEKQPLWEDRRSDRNDPDQDEGLNAVAVATARLSACVVRWTVEVARWPAIDLTLRALSQEEVFRAIGAINDMRSATALVGLSPAQELRALRERAATAQRDGYVLPVHEQMDIERRVSTLQAQVCATEEPRPLKNRFEGLDL